MSGMGNFVVGGVLGSIVLFISDFYLKAAIAFYFIYNL